MNRLEKMLNRWNFRKIAVWYLIAAVVTALVCAGLVGWLYRERLNFAWQYSKLEEAKQDDALRAAAEKTAGASDDVVDILILDAENQVTYSAKNSEFAGGTFALARIGEKKNYLASDAYPDAVFQYVKGEEFMLKSIVSKDFGKIREDYEDDSAFETNLSARRVYMLSRIRVRGTNQQVYVISVPTSVPAGMFMLKLSAALAALFFGVYWVLLALWMYQDAAKRRLSALYWGAIGLLTNLIGLIVYKIYKRGAAICTSCGAVQNAGHLYCTFCGKPLGMRCEGCGGKVGARDEFCPHCGKMLH